MKATKLEELARSKGMTQEDLAFASKITISTVRRLWQDRDYSEDPKISTLRALARVLGADINAFGYSEERGQLPEQQMSLAGAGA